MPLIWRVEFFPESGERYSPYDYIYGLREKRDQAQIIHRLTVMSETEKGDWSNTWVHKILDDIFQLTADNHRIMYCLDNKAIVVLHACRKVKKKTLQKDIDRAIIHYNQYMSRKKRH